MRRRVGDYVRVCVHLVAVDALAAPPRQVQHAQRRDAEALERPCFLHGVERDLQLAAEWIHHSDCSGDHWLLLLDDSKHLGLAKTKNKILSFEFTFFFLHCGIKKRRVSMLFVPFLNHPKKRQQKENIYIFKKGRGRESLKV